MRHGVWAWSDPPDAPLRVGTGTSGDGQLVIRPDGGVLGPVSVYGSSPAWAIGNFSKELATVAERSSDITLRGGNTGCALIFGKNLRRALTVNAKGELLAYDLDGEWRPRVKMSESPLLYDQFEGPALQMTTLGVQERKLLAADDGWAIVFESAGRNWTEIGRWNSWGPGADEKFGPEIYFCLQGSRLWVSDTMRARVIVFDLAARKPLAVLGRVDKPGAGVNEFRAPSAISANRDRAVVVDKSNFWIVKLELVSD